MHESRRTHAKKRGCSVKKGGDSTRFREARKREKGLFGFGPPKRDQGGTGTQGNQLEEATPEGRTLSREGSENGLKKFWKEEGVQAVNPSFKRGSGEKKSKEREWGGVGFV